MKTAYRRLGLASFCTSAYRRFAPDGRRIALDRVDGGLQLFEVPTGKPLPVIRSTDIPGGGGIVGSSLAFTPDGKRLAAVCGEGRCGIWETATGRLVRWLDGVPFYSIIQCDFSPDGKLLAVGAGGAGVGVYEVESGRQLFTTPGTNSVFDPDGKSMVTWDGYALTGGGKEQTTRSVAVPTGKVLSEFTNAWQLVDFFPPRSRRLLGHDAQVPVALANPQGLAHVFRHGQGVRLSGDQFDRQGRRLGGRHRRVLLAGRLPGRPHRPHGHREAGQYDQGQGPARG